MAILLHCMNHLNGQYANVFQVEKFRAAFSSSFLLSSIKSVKVNSVAHSSFKNPRCITSPLWSSKAIHV